MPKNTRTILVVWSWQRSGIGEGIWQVAGANHANDQVVCWDHLANEETILELKQMIRSYTQYDGELMVFLHRHHGYHQEHIQQLLTLAPMSNPANLKCFLFGEGAEGIYLTADPRGLLGTSGTFSANINYKGQQVEVSSIADFDRKELNPSHFDYVWDLYQFAFRKRIFELKEDLLSTLMEQKGTELFPPGELYALLNTEQNKLIMLRLLSFIGRIRKNSNLAKEIRTFERNNNRTFTFDDCGILLESSYGSETTEQYNILVDFILKNVLSKGGNVSLLDIRSKFDALLLRIYGPTYHT